MKIIQSIAVLVVFVLGGCNQNVDLPPSKTDIDGSSINTSEKGSRSFQLDSIIHSREQFEQQVHQVIKLAENYRYTLEPASCDFAGTDVLSARCWQIIEDSQNVAQRNFLVSDSVREKFLQSLVASNFISVATAPATLESVFYVTDAALSQQIFNKAETQSDIGIPVFNATNIHVDDIAYRANCGNDAQERFGVDISFDAKASSWAKEFIESNPAAGQTRRNGRICFNLFDGNATMVAMNIEINK